MNKLTRCFFDRVLAILLASLMLYMGCALPAAAQSQATTQQTNPRYDGETVFRGVFLDDGPVAKLFPEIWENPAIVGYLDQDAQAGAKEQVAAARQYVIKGLRVQDPTFFDRFEKEMQSGDHIRIRQAMNEVGERLVKLSENSPTLQNNSSWFIYKQNFIFQQNYVFLQNVLAIYQYIYQIIAPTPFSFDDASGLRRDMMVDLVAKRLGPQAAAAQ